MGGDLNVYSTSMYKVALITGAVGAFEGGE